jgi:replicative DNA helicase
VSVAEFPGAPPTEFDRTPPQDLSAEQCVLGGMMLSKDAIADVVEALRSVDFYKPAHQLVYDAVLDLYGRGEPADAVTVAAELTKRGEIGRAGGAPYLHTLISSVPTAANAGYYAAIVRERAILRRLVEAGTRITQMGYSGDGEVDAIVDAAQAEVYAVTDRRSREDYLPLAEIMEGTLDEIEAIGSRGGAMVGVPTGFGDLDQLTNGFHPGQMVIVAARPAIGKALALDTPLPCPSGWTTMGEVQVGDELIGADGKPTRVVAATEVLHGRLCYEVEFSDGTVIVADAHHQWRTEVHARRPLARAAVAGRAGPGHRGAVTLVRTTAEIAESLRSGTAERRVEHSVVNAEPLKLPARRLPLAPYSLGVRLARQHAATAAKLGMNLRPVTGPGERRIPMSCLRASEAQRRALLAGLLDATGSVGPTGAVQFACDDAQLARDVRELVVSLGYRCGSSRKRVLAHSITFSTSDPVFRLTRKRLLHAERCVAAGVRGSSRTITAVRPVPSVPVRCVQVDNDDHMYLASRAMIPTHNSTLALDFARSASIRHGLASVIFSLEMGRNEITMRLLSAEARVALHTMRSGTLTDDDWTRLARRMGEVSSAPLFIDDSPNMTMMEIRAKARRLKQRNDLRLVVVDYMQLMQSGKRVESRQQEVSEFSRSLKLLAKELEVPVIALSQLNRGPEQRTDKKPMLSDLRESGCLTADTRILRADTGAEVSLGELIATGARDVPVWSLDDRLKLVPRTLTHAFPSGVKEVFRVRLASGREVSATANHPFLTYDGWRALGDLMVGARVAVPRHMPAPLNVNAWDDDEVVLLAHLIGDGSFVRRQPIRYASVDEENLAVVAEAAARRFGITAVRDEYAAARVTTLRLPAPYRLTHGKRNPIAAWLDGLGLFGLRSYEKYVPAGVFGLPNEQVALFLRHIWATDGCVRWDARKHVGQIYYATTSRQLAENIAQLLLRFNVFTRIATSRKAGYRDSYHVHMYGVDNQLRFLEDIGVHGERGTAAVRLVTMLQLIKSKPKLDTIPRDVWMRVKSALRDRSMTQRELAAALGRRSLGSFWYAAPTRGRLAEVAAILDNADLEVLATNDVYWDSIASVESMGPQQVYDATVVGTHNFVANGISMHNSLEQDSDMVILLHREDAYERESPRAGEADLIVAKHRNGPTATVTVAFQGHYSRFVDMAQG